MNANEFESTLRHDGFAEVQTRELPAGHCTSEHQHPFDVRALVLAGEITLDPPPSATECPCRPDRGVFAGIALSTTGRLA